ncbi:MAG: bile acid:sodium symporter, partial [Bacteroidales bacterium]|nr:bile acid:sodium symporter [Bacteroidales bacterium]
ALVHFLEKGELIRLDVMDSIKNIFIIIIIPIIIGMLIRKYAPGFSNKMEKPVRIASAIVLALVIIGIVIKEKENFVSYFQQAGIVALLLNVSTMVVGYFSARLFRITDKRALSISIESGIQNGTLAITVAVVLLGSTEFAIAPAIYSLLMFFTGGVVIYIGLRREKKKNPSATA